VGIVDVNRKKQRAVFFDRDGVLNAALVRDQKPYPPSSLAELEIFTHATDLLKQLKERGFYLIVATNQPDVGRGKQTKEAVDGINQAIRDTLPIDAIFTCFHDNSDGCECRKPKPGLLLQASRQFGIDPARSYMVGDRWRDIDAGASIGCRTVWIDYHYHERGPSATPDARVSSLREAVEWILNDVYSEENR